MNGGETAAYTFSKIPMRLIFPPISCLTSSQRRVKFRLGFVFSPMRYYTSNGRHVYSRLYGEGKVSEVRRES